MPNHCENDLIVTGGAAELADFIAAVGKPGKHGSEQLLSFHAVIPYPAEYSCKDDQTAAWDEAARKIRARARNGEVVAELDWTKRPKDGYNDGGYEWCIKNWGTKWDAYELKETGRTPERWAISFDMAWSPPNPVIEELGRRFPTLRLEMRSYEMGCAFQQRLIVDNGVVIECDVTDYFGSRGG